MEVYARLRYSPDSVASSSAISSDGIGEALALRARLSQQALLQAAVPPAFPAEPVRGPARRPEIDRMHRAQRDHALRLTPSPPDTTEQQRSHNLASASPSAACSTVGDANCRSASDVTTAVSCVSVVVGLGANAAYSRVGTHKPRSSESFPLRCRSTMASPLWMRKPRSCPRRYTGPHGLAETIMRAPGQGCADLHLNRDGSGTQPHVITRSSPRARPGSGVCVGKRRRALRTRHDIHPGDWNRARGAA